MTDRPDSSAHSLRAAALPVARHAPGPRGRPIFGNYFDLQRDPLGFLIRVNREFGHVVRFHALGRLWHLITHPDHLEHVLQRRWTNYPKREFARLVSLASGNGLLALEGDAWARSRRLMQPAFHGDRLIELVGGMQAEVERLLDGWARLPDPRRIEPWVEFSRLTLAIVSRSLFSADLSESAGRFGDAFTRTLAYLQFRLVHPFAFPLSVPTPRNRRYRRTVATLDEIIMSLIQSRRRDDQQRHDLLAMLMTARDEQGDGLSDVELREEMKTLLTAGHETTAATLFWCAYLLARHPEAERRLHAEVDQLAGSPTFEDLPRLRFTRMVLDEAMRLYPTVMWQGRIAAEDDEIGGFTIPRHSRILLGFYITHRHPDFWEQPDAFLPHRFELERSQARPRGAFLPFGLGPRNCIGINFALVESVITLASIARRFRLRLEADQPVQPQVLATLRPPPGVMMRLEPR